MDNGKVTPLFSLVNQRSLLSEELEGGGKQWACVQTNQLWVLAQRQQTKKWLVLYLACRGHPSTTPSPHLAPDPCDLLQGYGLWWTPGEDLIHTLDTLNPATTKAVALVHPGEAPAYIRLQLQSLPPHQGSSFQHAIGGTSASNDSSPSPPAKTKLPVHPWRSPSWHRDLATAPHLSSGYIS